MILASVKLCGLPVTDIQPMTNKYDIYLSHATILFYLVSLPYALPPLHHQQGMHRLFHPQCQIHNLCLVC
jgi:hypothetical protein